VLRSFYDFDGVRVLEQDGGKQAMDDNLKDREVKNRIEQIIRQYQPVGARAVHFPEDADLRELGLDSVTAMEMFAEIESEFDVRFGEAEIDLCVLNSLNAIASRVAGKLKR
jgi:acyl carrier protein